MRKASGVVIWLYGEGEEREKVSDRVPHAEGVRE